MAGEHARPSLSTSALGLFACDSLLAEEDRAIRDTVRGFLADNFRAEIADWFDRGELPRSIVSSLGRMGLLGMHLEGYGCAGASALGYGLACLELEAVDSGLRSIVSVQGSLAMYAIRAYGSDDQCRQWLPGMAAGDLIGCFGLTEADAGSDPAGMRTRARMVGPDWVLDGTKMWITNGGWADVAVVWAQTPAGVRAFLVPRDTPGFSTRPVRRKLSLRASVTSELILERCRLPAAAMLPGAEGLGAALACLNEARFGIIFGAAGAARDCLDCAMRFASQRHQFGRPIAGFQLTQRKLADMTMDLTSSYLLALHIAKLKDAGQVRPEHISGGKLHNVSKALAIARESRTILGASGITLDYPVLRHTLNLESVLTYEGTAEIHTLVMGQALTRIGAFR